MTTDLIEAVMWLAKPNPVAEVATLSDEEKLEQSMRRWFGAGFASEKAAKNLWIKCVSDELLGPVLQKVSLTTTLAALDAVVQTGNWPEVNVQTQTLVLRGYKPDSLPELAAAMSALAERQEAAAAQFAEFVQADEIPKLRDALNSSSSLLTPAAKQAHWKTVARALLFYFAFS